MASSALRLHLARPPSLLSGLPPFQRLPLLSIPFTSSPFPLPSPPLPRLRRFSCSSALTPSTPSFTPTPTPTPPLPHLLLDLREDGESNSGEVEVEDVEEESEPGDETELAVGASAQLPSFPSPQLSVKEKKELASYAHSLGKKLKSQQVGKSGVTPSMAASFLETLEANELLKIKVHRSCPGELSDVIKQLEESTGSVAVGQIGQSVILYRPSLSKMKKREAQSARKVWNPRPMELPTKFKAQNSGKVRHGQDQIRHA